MLLSISPPHVRGGAELSVMEQYKRTDFMGKPKSARGPAETEKSAFLGSDQ